MTSRAGTDDASRRYAVAWRESTYDPQGVRPVDRFVFVNRETLCPVCLKALDITVDDVVPYLPTYLSPFDSLRAYDGCYHRACLYRVGDYPRMVEAWHRGVQATIRDAEGKDWPRVVAFERDFAAIRWSAGSPLELLLFPRFARWEFSLPPELGTFVKAIDRFCRKPNRRQAFVDLGGLELRSVANHDLVTMRRRVGLTIRAEWATTNRLPVAPRRGLFGPQAIRIDLGDLPEIASLHYHRGELEPELDWDLRSIGGTLLPNPRETPAWRTVGTIRMRFVPIWDDELDAMQSFLSVHHDALIESMGREEIG